ncbi:extracellular solute-binding protein [Haloarchaeobius sp. HME9146]|uniref:extracellular solute-binding protein n=1 Tax=Haloarchaeobius sp. HME9146 TaxID=2978732 RepID=UPI0021BFE098|nr:extracellular solute-binding protein [Haloarchaeobius sp. HME9146]MCT9096593.1 extracellular solute-binding protein [Haloarchaeobius sp. HME9146]
MRDFDDSDSSGSSVNRRRFLAAAAATGVTTVAGCLNSGSDSTDTTEPTDSETGGGELGSVGSGMEGRPAPGGTPMSEMPDLSGTLTLYSGRGKPLVNTLIEYIEGLYDGFTINTRYDSSNALANKITTAGAATEADVLFSVNAGALGLLANENRTVALPQDVQEMVPTQYRNNDGEWTGTSGRARTIPYNTNAYSESEIPDDIFAFPDFDGSMGWAPGYGSFQAFVTAMRVMNGREETKQWLQGMLDAGVERYPDEFIVSRAVANGDLDAGFANHYYIQRVLDGNEDAPIATAFTNNDAGAIFNVAGAAVVDTSENGDQTAENRQTAVNFVRHLLSAEAQEYFATRTFEYPVIPEVNPVGDLPPVDELNTPDFDLAKLSDIGPTIDLMREVGIQV